MRYKISATACVQFTLLLITNIVNLWVPAIEVMVPAYAKYAHFRVALRIMAVALGNGQKHFAY